MPLFQDVDAQAFKTNGSGFQFSGAKINNLGSSEYTLVGIAADRSGSVAGFASEIESCVKSALEGCQKSPRVDNLMARLLAFNHDVTEEHGFRPLGDCHLANYDGFLKPGGSTSLYDASVNLIDSLATYGKQLIDQDYMANGIVIVVTDGIDEGSTLSANAVKEALDRARMSESLESIVTILVGINVQTGAVSRYLKGFKDAAGFDQYVEAQDATPKTMARLANFISKSVSSQSQSLGSGAASLPITF